MRYKITEETQKRLDNSFSYHAPRDDQPSRYVSLRQHAKELAHLIVVFTPPGREQSLAITKLEEVVFWANAAIARGE